MKSVITLFSLFLLTTLSYAQQKVDGILEGIVLDENNQPLYEATIKLGDDGLGTFANEDGKFKFTNVAPGDYTLEVIYLGYKTYRTTVNPENEEILSITLKQSAYQITPIAVISNWVKNDAPITHTNLDEETIQQNNLGQDVPYLLKWTPSVVVTSDGGTGIGYTGIRIRGSDPTRVNVTINGLPLNDTESHGVFWVDLPDFASSTNNIQIQRGVGTSVNGAGAFGGSINLNTNVIHEKPYGTIAGTIGSFNTQKLSLRAGTGLIKDKFFFDGRLSTIQSDGYIDRATADLRSFYTTAGYVGAKSSLYLNVFSGHEVTYQAWNGVPAQYVADNPTFNTAGTEKEGTPHDNEVDDYTQTHFQLHYNQSIGADWSMSSKLNYTKGKGFFEQYKGEEDLIDYNIVYTDSVLTDDVIRRRWLDNDFYGGNIGLNYSPANNYSLKFGVSLFEYLGKHFGEAIWTPQLQEITDPTNYYENDATKQDMTVYVIQDYQFTPKLNGYLDLQYRRINYEFEGFDNDGNVVTQDDQLGFFNPKVGLNYGLNKKQNIYAYFGVGNKEPNRNDYTESTPDSRPSHETLYNTELGYRYNTRNINVGANAYFMDYKNQLALTGQLNDVGAATRINIEDSYRAGIELDANIKLKSGIHIGSSLTLSQNKIKSFDEYIDNWDTWGQDSIRHTDTDLAFSPNIIWSGSIGYDVMTPFSVDDMSLDISLLGKYVGKQFIDNTSNENTMLDAYTYTDSRLVFSYKKGWFKNAKLTFLVRNLFDQKFSTNAWTYRYNSANYDGRPDDPYTRLEGGDTYNLIGFYPQAGRNFLLGLEVGF